MARGKGLQIQSTFGVFLIFLTLSFLTYLAESKGAFKGLHGIVQNTTRPAREALYQVRQGLTLSTEIFTEYTRVNQKNAELETRVASLSSSLAELSSLREENKRMKLLLGTNLPPSWKFEAAKLVLSTGDEITLISLGGFVPEIGTPVVIAERDEGQTGDRGVYVGKVEKNIGEEVLVIKPSNSLSKIGVFVRNKDTGERRASGIVVGKGGEALLDQVLSGEKLAEGDLIVTSGEGKLPPELILGYVGKIFQNESSPWKQAEVKAVLQPDKLDYVFFISKY